MNPQDNEKLAALLRSALPPVGGTPPPGDLWPRMLRRLERQPAPFALFDLNWFDLALVGLAVAGFIAFPTAIPWIVFQF